MPISEEENSVPLFYRYTPIGTWLPAFLKGESLQFSSRKSFNDPFGCRPGYKLSGGKELDKFLHDRFKRFGFRGADRVKAVHAAKNRSASVRQISSLSDESILDQVGVLCLATDWNNSLMWSHYADQHKGICVSFHSDIDVFKIAFRVKYTDDFPIIVRPKDEIDVMFAKAFLTKAKCWSYENEWRVIKPHFPEEARNAEFLRYLDVMTLGDASATADKRGPGIYRFQKRSIESITLGMRTSDKDKAWVINACENAGLDIPIYQINKLDGSYLLSREAL
jgi:hypothetical protein